MPTDETFVVDESEVGSRLDVFVVAKLPEYSRSKIRNAITAGQITVGGKTAKPSYKMVEGEVVQCQVVAPAVETPQAEDIPLDILFDDEDFVVVNKPPQMVVHPSKGHWQGTLTAALSFHFQNLSTCGGAQRPGIVHRLDRDTSGVIIVAKNDTAHMNLAAQFEHRQVVKEYFALISPPPDRERDWIEQPIGVHPYQREKMAIRENHQTSREAKTFYEVQKKFGRFGLVKVLPKTGRTHQIRVHLQHIGCPVIADKLYSGTSKVTMKDLSVMRDGSESEVVLTRQALHARRLEIDHPRSGERMEFVAPIPADIQAVLDRLEEIYD